MHDNVLTYVKEQCHETGPPKTNHRYRDFRTQGEKVYEYRFKIKARHWGGKTSLHAGAKYDRKPREQLKILITETYYIAPYMRGKQRE